MLEAIERISGDGGVIPSTEALLARAAELAEEHSISVYDAAYVVAARQGERVLVSCDTRDLLSKGLALSPERARAEDPSGGGASAREGHESASAGPGRQ